MEINNSNGAVPPLRVIGHEDKRPGNKHAVFVRLQVQDSKGQFFYFDASCFIHDLTPLEKA